MFGTIIVTMGDSESDSTATGLFNFFIFLPVALILNFTKREGFNALTLKQFGLVVGKGLLDYVLSDYIGASTFLQRCFVDQKRKLLSWNLRL
ncbi:unnamed protein product [Eruca vesicaria subsp. sativa]|uniref:Uncharacterized protein n=1 Tax=Eruca vesicaria subsp. sativa TaxID=29727 RepID=A0ABC8KKW9_ERUVS|nr:unnamed protein product [Eruca vesicaria subsp. sativa]